jgi:hypothetical protein
VSVSNNPMQHSLQPATDSKWRASPIVAVIYLSCICLAGFIASDPPTSSLIGEQNEL